MSGKEVLRIVRIMVARMFLSGLLFIGFAWPAAAQLAQISHFVSPSYPHLARRAVISGQVSLKLTIDESGAVVSISEESSAHPLLTEGAKRCATEWRFEPAATERRVFVVFYYGFSGTSRETDPATTVKVDFLGTSIRVFLVTDPAPTVHE